MIYKDAVVVHASPLVSKDNVDFLTKVITKESRDNFRRIHVHKGVAFCISMHRLHGVKLGIEDGIYDYAEADGGYRLTKVSESDKDLGAYLELTQFSLVYPVRLHGVPEINITAAKSLSKNGLVAGLAYNLIDELMRFTGFYPNPGIEAYSMNTLMYVSPEYLYDALGLLGTNINLSMSANRRFVQLWNDSRFVMLAGVNPKFPSDMLTEFPDEPKSGSSGETRIRSFQ